MKQKESPRLVLILYFSLFLCKWKYNCFFTYPQAQLDTRRTQQQVNYHSPTHFNVLTLCLLSLSNLLGLTGAGQLIGVADSGLNEVSCFFEDNNSDRFQAPLMLPRVSKIYVKRYNGDRNSPSRRKRIFR